jgi:hypothetical protein
VDEISDFVFEDADRVVMERNINGSGIFDFHLMDRAYVAAAAARLTRRRQLPPRPQPVDRRVPAADFLFV